MNTTRDYAAEYLTARKARHAATTMREQEQAEELASAIDDAAYDAGVNLDLITLDEQARLVVFPDAPRARTI